jgi:hypothetical protein
LAVHRSSRPTRGDSSNHRSSTAWRRCVAST